MLTPMEKGIRLTPEIMTRELAVEIRTCEEMRLNILKRCGYPLWEHLTMRASGYYDRVIEEATR